ncbi:MAG: PTS sugar transporter subunit IIB [Candidatus Bathyarchaeota archaeon]|nr:PTS sugar transporter subunit IIB [Candidatus Bathyarchaeota archaeon]
MKVLVVCGCGFGSGLILKDNVEKALAELGISASVEVRAYTVADTEDADLFVTHTSFADKLESAGKPVVVLHSMVDMKEIRSKLKAYFGK